MQGNRVWNLRLAFCRRETHFLPLGTPNPALTAVFGLVLAIQVDRSGQMRLPYFSMDFYLTLNSFRAKMVPIRARECVPIEESVG